MKCKCGNPATHEVFGDEVAYLCCECYVGAGGTPADWHSECMRAVGRVAVAWPGESLKNKGLTSPVSEQSQTKENLLARISE